MGTIPRRYLLNSTGDPQDGTPLDDQEWQDLQTAIESEFYTANHPTVTTRSIIDNLIGGVPFQFGGDPNAAVVDSITWPPGITYNTILPGSGIWRVDTAHMQEGLYQLEAMAAVVANDFNGGDVGDLGQLALFDFSGATPNVPIVNSIINGIGLGPGPILLRSAGITPANLPAPFTLRDLVVKAYGPGAIFWNVRFFRYG